MKKTKNKKKPKGTDYCCEVFDLFESYECEVDYVLGDIYAIKQEIKGAIVLVMGLDGTPGFVKSKSILLSDAVYMRELLSVWIHRQMECVDAGL